MAADHAAAAAALRARLFPDGGAPEDDGDDYEDYDSVGGVNGGSVNGDGGGGGGGGGGSIRRRVRHELTVLRASLITTTTTTTTTGGGGDDAPVEEESECDVTEAVRARLAEAGGERLVIKVSENLRDVLNDPPPLLVHVPAAAPSVPPASVASAPHTHTRNTTSSLVGEGRLLVEYKTTTTRSDGASSSSSAGPPYSHHHITIYKKPKP